jgi:lysophospholipase L1-like esterase
MRRLTLAASLAAVAGLFAVAGCAVQRLDESRRLARASTAFSVAPRDATASLLIVGDSTAAGTGASTPATSLAGQLAEAFPNVAITNLGHDGARFADVARQLEQAPGARYDAVLIQAGGNDVIRLTREGALREGVERSLALARNRAPLVVVMPAGNVGNAPFFVPPASWWMTSRARSMHAIVRDAAQRAGAVYVDLYKPKDEDVFAQDPRRFHASDGLHPSDAGYAQWLAELLEQSPLGSALDGQRSASR